MLLYNHEPVYEHISTTSPGQFWPSSVVSMSINGLSPYCQRCVICGQTAQSNVSHLSAACHLKANKSVQVFLVTPKGSLSVVSFVNIIWGNLWVFLRKRLSMATCVCLRYLLGICHFGTWCFPLFPVINSMKEGSVRDWGGIGVRNRNKNVVLWPDVVYWNPFINVVRLTHSG